MTTGLNLVRYSSYLTQSLWNKMNVAIADLAGTTSSPTGRACRVIFAGGDSGSQWSVSQTAIPEYESNSQFTLSVWLLQESWSIDDIELRVFASDNNGVTQVSAPSTWTISSAVDSTDTTTGTPPWSSPTGSITALASSWKRLTVTGTTPATLGLTLGVELSGASAPIGNSFLVGGFALYEGTGTDFVDTTIAPQGSQFLPTFDFPYHNETTRYPQNSSSVQFGNSYVFSSKPIGPPQRTFLLEFPALVNFVNDDGTMNTTYNSQMNAGALDEFYQEVQLFGQFYYNHPRYGLLVCMFNKPLEIPRAEVGGGGVVKNLQIELREIPL